MAPDITRRDFLKATGALIVSFSASSVASDLSAAQGPFDTRRSHIVPHNWSRGLPSQPMGV